MTSTSTRSAATGNVAGLSGLNAAADLGRQQMAVMAEGAAAMFRGFEAIRKIQEEAAHKAFARHSAAADKLRGNCPPADLVALQSDLVRFDVEGAMQYWQQVTAAALEMQTEVLGCATHLLDSEALLESASAMAAMEAAVPGFGKLLPAGPQAGARRAGSKSKAA
jgi:hypothetical protein